MYQCYIAFHLYLNVLSLYILAYVQIHMTKVGKDILDSMVRRYAGTNISTWAWIAFRTKVLPISIRTAIEKYDTIKMLMKPNSDHTNFGIVHIKSILLAGLPRVALDSVYIT